MRPQGISPAALMVIAVLGLVTLWIAAITGLLYLRGDLDVAKDAGILMGTSIAGLVGILARTGSSSEPSSTPQPVEIVNSPADPVQTVEAVPAASEFS